MVVADLFSKYAYFIPYDTNVTAAIIVYLFINKVFAAHGLPMEIISDCGPQFTSQL